MFGVNKCDLDFGVQIGYVKQPIQRNSAGSGHVSHRKTSSLHDNFDHSFIVGKKKTTEIRLRKFCACDNVTNIWQFIGFSVIMSFRFGLGLVLWVHCALNFSTLDYWPSFRQWSLTDWWVSLNKAILLSPQPTNREQRIHPFTKPASLETTSESLELSSSCPFCDCLNKFVNRPKNATSTIFLFVFILLLTQATMLHLGKTCHMSWGVWYHETTLKTI